MAVERYPSFSAGQTITASLLTSSQFALIRKLSDTSRSSTTTTTDDPDLAFDLEADATYFAEFFVRYACISAAGFKLEITVPSGATGNYGVSGLCSTVSDAAACGDARYGVHNFTTTTIFGDRNSATNQCLAIISVLVATDSTAGTLAIAWAQETSDATATKVAAGSFARLQRVA